MKIHLIWMPRTAHTACGLPVTQERQVTLELDDVTCNICRVRAGLLPK
jgi:hypothetical protein